jgi:TRAP transporter TAXI family solute receptor
MLKNLRHFRRNVAKHCPGKILQQGELMKRFSLSMAAMLFGIFVTASPALAAGKITLNLMSTPFGTGSYVLGTAVETIVNRGNYSISIAHTESPGQAFNVNKLSMDAAARKNTVGTASKGINWLAARGTKPFTEKRTPLKLIGSYGYCVTWLVATESSLKSVMDLEGKRIAMGRIPQVIWGYEPDALLRNGYTEEFYKTLKIQYVGTTEAATALVNGQVDAATIGGYADPVGGKFSPAPQTVEIAASGRKLVHLDWTRAAVEQTATKDIPLVPYEVTANSVEGQSQALWSGADIHGLFAHPEFPDDLAYILAKAMIDHVGEFAQYHALGGLMSREGLVRGMSEEEIHPGALRAYKEAGIIK